MKKYKIFITSYNMNLDHYIVDLVVVNTNDIYYEINLIYLIYCTSLVKIEDVSYFEV